VILTEALDVRHRSSLRPADRRAVGGTRQTPEPLVARSLGSFFRAAGVMNKLWSVEDIVALVDAAEKKPGERGPYKKRLAA
jgi:hypothetical protein